MRFDARLIGFGLFFIVFGGVLLAGRQGLIAPELLERGWQLWPLLLVGSGLSIVLARRPGASLGVLVVAATLGAMAGGFVGSGSGLPIVGCGGDESGGSAFGRQGGSLGQGTRVEVEFNCGELSVATGGGDQWSLDGTSEGGRAPVVDLSDDELRLEPGGSGVFPFGRARESWDLTLPTGPRIELDLSLNAGASSVDLDGARLGALTVDANAGSIRVDLRGIDEIDDIDLAVNAGSAVLWLPERGLAGRATANAGSLTFCAPEGVGLRLVTGGGAISSNDFGEQGLDEVDGGWETPGFSTAAIRITIEATANAGSLSLNPVRTCTG